jgi:hypothetical protein
MPAGDPAHRATRVIYSPENFVDEETVVTDNEIAS